MPPSQWSSRKQASSAKIIEVLSFLQGMQQIIQGQGGKLVTKIADPVKREDRKNGAESSTVPLQVTNPVDFTGTTISSVSFGG